MNIVFYFLLDKLPTNTLWFLLYLKKMHENATEELFQFSAPTVILPWSLAAAYFSDELTWKNLYATAYEFLTRQIGEQLHWSALPEWIVSRVLPLSLNLLLFLGCTPISMDVLPLLPCSRSFHFFNTSYFTRPFSQVPSQCNTSLSTDLSSSLWCLSQAPSTDSNRPQLFHRQDMALQLLHCARSQQHVLGLLISVLSIS